MTSRTLTEEQRESLDYQTEQLHKSFARAFKTKSYQDAVWNIGLFDTYQKSLEVATDYAAFFDWERSTARAQVFDKYLLQYAIGGTACYSLENRIRFGHIAPLPEKKLRAAIRASLKKAIDNCKVSYWQIQSIARQMANTSDFLGILDALKYVKEK